MVSLGWARGELNAPLGDCRSKDVAVLPSWQAVKGGSLLNDLDISEEIVVVRALVIVVTRARHRDGHRVGQDS